MEKLQCVLIHNLFIVKNVLKSAVLGDGTMQSICLPLVWSCWFVSRRGTHPWETPSRWGLPNLAALQREVKGHRNVRKLKLGRTHTQLLTFWSRLSLLFTCWFLSSDLTACHIAILNFPFTFVKQTFLSWSVLFTASQRVPGLPWSCSHPLLTQFLRGRAGQTRSNRRNRGKRALLSKRRRICMT
jgi:hypothetical protein